MNKIFATDWKLALLKQNPFPNTPPTRPEDSVWAGFPDLRKQLDALFAEAVSTSRTQIVLNKGEYGSGKTHAAIFYRRKDYLAQFYESKKVKDVEIVYIRTPKEPDKAGITLYQNIIEHIQFRHIRSVIKELVMEYGDQESLEKLQELTESEPLARAIWLLGHEQGRGDQLPLFQDTNIANSHQKLIESYFYSDATKNDLRRRILSVIGGLFYGLTSWKIL